MPIFKVSGPDGTTYDVEAPAGASENEILSAAARMSRASKKVTAADLEESEYSSTGDVFRGIGAGVVSAAEGLATLPAELIDYASDGQTSEAEQVRNFYAKLKPTTYTGAGEAAKFITQFALPGTVASKIAKARKLGKFAEVAAFAGTDFAVATQDVELRKQLRRIPGVPLLYTNRSVMVLETVSHASRSHSGGKVAVLKNLLALSPAVGLTRARLSASRGGRGPEWGGQRGRCGGRAQDCGAQEAQGFWTESACDEKEEERTRAAGSTSTRAVRL
jgi:hypothetical protein